MELQKYMRGGLDVSEAEVDSLWTPYADPQRALDAERELCAAWAEKARQYELELDGDPQNLHGQGRTFGLRQQLATLQADHARVLGLVQALRVVGLPAEHTRPDDFILLKTGEGWMAHTYNYWAKFATEEEARAYIALLEYRSARKPLNGST